MTRVHKILLLLYQYSYYFPILIHTIIHFIETRLQNNWHNNKKGDGLVNRLASNLVILNQAHRVSMANRARKNSKIVRRTR